MNANSGLPEAGAPGDASADSAEVMADTTGVPRQARDGERSRTISPWRLHLGFSPHFLPIPFLSDRLKTGLGYKADFTPWRSGRVFAISDAPVIHISS